MQRKFSAILIIAAVLSSGCSLILEFPRTIWGSSTRDLQNGRATAIKKTYHCSVTECFDAVLKLTEIPPEEKLAMEEAEEAAKAADPNRAADDPSTPIISSSFGKPEPAADGLVNGVIKPQKIYLDLFMKDRKRNFIVVMGVPNCVDTTEVGVFFTSLDDGNVQIDISSLSTKAKINASEVIFADLNERFPEIQ